MDYNNKGMSEGSRVADLALEYLSQADWRIPRYKSKETSSTFWTRTHPGDKQHSIQIQIQLEMQTMSPVEDVAGRQPSSISPAHRLVEDLLSTIFQFCVDPLNREAPNSLAAESSALRSIHHVNRRWREVALGCPVLWGKAIDPDSCGVQWLDLVLRRSKKAPIFIVSKAPEAHVAPAKSMEKWKLLTDNFDRCVYLYALLGPGRSESGVYEVLWKGSASLKRCIIKSELSQAPTHLPGFGQWQGIILQPRSVGSRALFDGQAPNLQELKLVNCHLDSRKRPVSLPSLRSVSMLTLSTPHTQWMSGSVVLRSLFLTVLPPWNLSSASGESRTRTALPALQQLHITTGIAGGTEILDSIDTTDMCDFSLAITFPSFPPATTGDVTAFWDALFRHFWSSTFTSIAVKYDGAVSYFRATTSANRVLQVIMDTTHARLDYNSSEFSFLPTIPEVYQSPLQLSSYISWYTMVKRFSPTMTCVKTLEVDVIQNRSFPLDTMFLVSKLPAVETLRMQHSTTTDPTWYKILMVRYGDESQGKDGRLPAMLPKLQLLELPQDLPLSIRRELLDPYIAYRVAYHAPVTVSFRELSTHYESPIMF
ncbi:hypothetical protein DFP72DRAFT_1079579 [Ephemerocybe angulata]|uniref:F-box domain-containing protein n=1 Tax=Ephemerocybe angulata TaxID=980116 RepID=A0A8H6HB84_9AGAR|nr:hypothetical protein DFP72DRAFT_1079579 [Tulosesus angulatus]